MDSRVLSQIRIIPTEKIRPFEWNGADHQFISTNSTSEIISHPFVVTELENGEFMVVDDGDLFYVLKDRGVEYLPVQICPPDELRLDSQRLGLVDFHSEDLIRVSARHADQIVLGEKSEIDVGDQTFLPIKFDFTKTGEQSVYLRHSSRIGCPPPLELIFRAIQKTGGYQPAIDRRHNRLTLTKAASVSGHVTIPRFSLDDLKSAITSEQLFPPGLIRVMPSKRVLGIDLPLKVLYADICIEEKENFLKDLISLREQNRRISYYEGRIYLLNR